MESESVSTPEWDILSLPKPKHNHDRGKRCPACAWEREERKRSAQSRSHDSPLNLQQSSAAEAQQPSSLVKCSHCAAFVSSALLGKHKAQQHSFEWQAEMQTQSHSPSDSPSPSPQLHSEDETVFGVDRVLETKIDADGTRLYFVKWFGFPDSENSWIPEENFYNGSEEDAVREFWERAERGESSLDGSALLEMEIDKDSEGPMPSDTSKPKPKSSNSAADVSPEAVATWSPRKTKKPVRFPLEEPDLLYPPADREKARKKKPKGWRGYELPAEFEATPTIKTEQEPQPLAVKANGLLIEHEEHSQSKSPPPQPQPQPHPQPQLHPQPQPQVKKEPQTEPSSSIDVVMATGHEASTSTTAEAVKKETTDSTVNFKGAESNSKGVTVPIASSASSTQRVPPLPRMPVHGGARCVIDNEVVIVLLSRGRS